MNKINSEERYVIYLFDLVVVIILAFDFIKRLLSNSEPIHIFLLKNWYEIPAMIPLILYSFFEVHYSMSIALRSLRLITLFRLVRLYRISTYFENNQFLYLALFTTITIVFGALSIYLVESIDKHANIKNIGDGFWWAIGTVTTVAYGDVYPITVDGKIIAVILMFASIGILGAFISTLGSKIMNSKIQNKLSIGSASQENSFQMKINKSLEKRPVISSDEINNLKHMTEISRDDINKILELLLEIKSQKSELPWEKNKCVKCNNIFPSHSNFCNFCGRKINP